MYPVLFHVGGYAVESAGVAYYVAAVVAAVYAGRMLRRRGWNRDHLLPGVIVTVLAAYAGARLHGAMLSWDAFVADPVSEIRTSGLSFFGGMVTGSLALVGYLRWRRIPVGEAIDELTPLAPVVYALFRLGCLLEGDDYGKPTSLPWGMSFPEGSPPTTERVHPTQIYEILLMAPVFGWLWSRRGAGLPSGALAFETCILMGAERFVVEFWRTTEMGPAGLTVSQWLAIALVTIGALGRLRLARERKAA